MIEYFGFVGLVLLLLAWSLQLTRYKRYFFFMAGIGSTVLMVYAIYLGDLPFTIVNGFIAVISFLKAK